MLGATALVSEGFARLFKTGYLGKEQSTQHFYSLFAKMMRHVLVEYERSKNTQKRGGLSNPVALDVILCSPGRSEIVSSGIVGGSRRAGKTIPSRGRDHPTQIFRLHDRRRDLRATGAVPVDDRKRSANRQGLYQVAPELMTPSKKISGLCQTFAGRLRSLRVPYWGESIPIPGGLAMTTTNWQRIRDAFEQCIQLPESERASYPHRTSSMAM